MKSHILPAIKLTLVCILVFSGVYTFAVWGIGQLIAPNQGKGETIYYRNPPDNSKYGFENVGQSFTADKYFWSRPSVIGYNAAGSGGSNKAPANKEYLAQAEARIDAFRVHNPRVKKSEIPVEMVTASGSGLDPDISPEAAQVQISRIARLRGIPEQKLKTLIERMTVPELFGFLGPRKVNVLKINIELDKLQ